MPTITLHILAKHFYDTEYLDGSEIENALRDMGYQNVISGDSDVEINNVIYTHETYNIAMYKHGKAMAHAVGWDETIIRTLILYK